MMNNLDLARAIEIIDNRLNKKCIEDDDVRQDLYLGAIELHKSGNLSHTTLNNMISKCIRKHKKSLEKQDLLQNIETLNLQYIFNEERICNRHMYDEMMKILTEKEVDIINGIYRKRLPYSQIAKEHNTTSYIIRKIEYNAILKLRNKFSK